MADEAVELDEEVDLVSDAESDSTGPSETGDAVEVFTADEEEEDDTTQEQHTATPSRDMQGIQWDRLPHTRAEARESRLKQYPNYTNVLPNDVTSKVRVGGWVRWAPPSIPTCALLPACSASTKQSHD